MSGLAVVGAASYYGISGALESRRTQSTPSQQSTAPPAGGPTQRQFSFGKTRSTDGLPDGEPVFRQSFDTRFEQIYTTGEVMLGIDDNTFHFGPVGADADGELLSGTVDGGTIDIGGVYRGSPVMLAGESVFRVTDDPTPIITGLTGAAAMGLTAEALVVADQQALQVKHGDNNPRRVEMRSVTSASGIVPDSLCIGSDGSIYIADTEGTIFETAIDEFETTADTTVSVVATASSIEAMAAADGRLVLQGTGGIGVVELESSTMRATSTPTDGMRPATNGRELVVAAGSTLRRFDLDSELEATQQYDTAAPIEQVQLAGRHAVATTAENTEIIDLDSGQRSTRPAQYRYIGPHYEIRERNGQTQMVGYGPR